MVSLKSSNIVKNILWIQWIAALSAMLVLFTLSLMIGWTSPYLARLTAENSPLPLTESEGSWMASLFNLGRFAGAVLGGISVNYLGSKTTLTLIGPPLMLSWILIIVANSAAWLYSSRIIGGTCMGMCYSSYPLYLGEISEPRNRGAMVALAITGSTFGFLAGNVMGTYVSMAVFSYISFVPTVVFILIFLWLPQSPHYLVRKHKFEEAKKSIVRLNPDADVSFEVKSLKSFITTSESQSFLYTLREFYLPRNRKAGLIVMMLYLFMQLSGLNTLDFYAETILISAGVSVVAPTTVVIIGSAVGIISGWLSVYIADKWQRKTLMIASCVGVGISLAAIAIHFAVINDGVDPEVLQWLPISAYLFFAFTVCGGLCSVPSIVLSEIFAPNIKSTAACFATILLSLLAFAITKSYQPLVTAVGEAYVFGGHALIMVMAVIFSAIFMPETKGKSLQEIQDDLVKN